MEGLLSTGPSSYIVNHPSPHPCARENGALQVVPGSHLLGRQVHRRTGDLAGVAEETMEQVASSAQLVTSLCHMSHLVTRHGKAVSMGIPL